MPTIYTASYEIEIDISASASGGGYPTVIILTIIIIVFIKDSVIIIFTISSRENDGPHWRVSLSA